MFPYSKTLDEETFTDEDDLFMDYESEFEDAFESSPADSRSELCSQNAVETSEPSSYDPNLLQGILRNEFVPFPPFLFRVATFHFYSRRLRRDSVDRREFAGCSNGARYIE